jgi:hypothetical protein
VRVYAGRTEDGAIKSVALHDDVRAALLGA